ncbi:MAG: acyl-CoA/acyl-ACP dehydrogenase [Burkholderiaceae bacterium]|nr:acyl-CoA/acyl-ACP dehydrogenase [Burkholderiaceae bacterium]
MSTELVSIADAFDALLQGELAAARHEEAGQGWSPALWAAAVQAGFGAIAVDEALGGAGASPAALGAVLERAGYHAAPAPVGRANIGALGCALLDAQGVAVGQHVVAIDLRRHVGLPGDPSAWMPLIAQPLRSLPWAAQCDELLALLPAERGEAWATRVPRAACRIEPATNIAGEPRADWLPTAPIAMRAAPRATVRRLCDLLALARASAIAGAVLRVLDLSFAYANDRQQFGRPIFAFQAVQHELAELASTAEQLRAMLSDAYERADGSDEGHLWSLAVETCAALAAARAIRTGHQLHGAVGITMEYELQRYTRRLMAWRDEGGSEARTGYELGRLLRGAPADEVWRVSTAWVSSPI